MPETGRIDLCFDDKPDFPVLDLLQNSAGIRVLNFVSRGKHTYNKFVTPEEMGNMLGSYNCKTKEVKGMLYNYFWGYWSWLKTTSTFYIMHVVKNMTDQDLNRPCAR